MPIEQGVLFSGTNLLDEATLTGGPTVSGSPLSKLQDEEMWKFARFSSLVAADTYVILEFSDTKTFQIFAALNHSLSTQGKWRVRVAETLSALTVTPTYDSGLVKITTAFSGYGTLPWGEFNWGDILPAEYGTLLNPNGWLILDEPVDGRFVRIDFDDALENDVGYIELARLWLGEIYQPTITSPYGAKLIPIDKTRINQAESGTRFYGTRYLRRSMSLEFDLTVNEMLFYIFGPLFMVKGQAGELVCILQPQAPETFVFQALHGNLQNINDVVHSTYARMTTSIIIDEKV